MWKKIIDYPRYEINEYGDVKDTLTNDIIKNNPNKDSYNTLSLLDSNGNPTRLRVHTLVCTAFNDVKPSDKDVVNHKDGRKSNNYYKNLEWVTNSENVIHAYETGLDKTAIRVRIHEINGDVRECYSILEASRQTGVSHNVINKLLRLYPNATGGTPYLFEPILDYHIPSKRGEDYRIKNYRDDTIVTVRGSTLAAIHTNLSTSTIINNCNTDKLINGYVITSNIEYKFPHYDYKFVHESIERHKSQLSYARRLVVKNHMNSDVKIMSSIKEASAWSGLPESMIKAIVFNERWFILARGFSFKATLDEREFIKYSDEEVKCSLLDTKGVGSYVRSINIDNGEIRLYGSIRELARELGRPDITIRRWINSGKLVDNKITIELIPRTKIH